MKFRTVCQDHQAGKSAIKCLFQKHYKMAGVCFEPRPCLSHSQNSNHSITLSTFDNTADSQPCCQLNVGVLFEGYKRQTLNWVGDQNLRDIISEPLDLLNLLPIVRFNSCFTS